jgi:hypothetical protein
MSELFEDPKPTSHAPLSGVVESLCEDCGCEVEYPGASYCEDCMEADRYYYEEEEKDYSDFDCTCGAWEWSEKAGKPIHIADCFCGSSEPW